MARGHFAKSETQAASVMKELQGSVIESVGTVRNYEQALKTCCDYLKEFKLGALREITPEKAEAYLQLRATENSQSTIDMDRQAIQAMMQHVTHKLEPDQHLRTDIESTTETLYESRSYTPEQVDRVMSHQTERHAISTEICQQAGLRAHELFTLRPSGEVTPSPREVHENNPDLHR